VSEQSAAHANPAVGGGALAALGIVYGDLGTSPLYTYQTIVAAVGGHPSPAEAVSLLSLVVWSLFVTVSIKYCTFVMRADNHGEGGILALMALITGETGRGGTKSAALVAMALFGAALIYGDGAITPAISVLSALEGVEVTSNVLKPYVLPVAIVVLVALFAVQSRGTASIGRVFGPVMLLWFVVIGLLGLAGVVREPQVFAALDPRLALGFLLAHGLGSLGVLGGVFLAVTGGEALYADMGHFGRMPIRSSWYVVVLPALLLSYAGQTAHLIEHPGPTGNPFFELAPGWAVMPLVGLATVATIIASQAIITGAFSLTRQAMQLGWFPGLNILQTSADAYGQIYVPFVNWSMMIATLVLTYGFGSSDRLAGAYGTAVSTTMLMTTALLFRAMRDIWRWNVVAALLASGTFVIFDVVFFAANMEKLFAGGWVPLTIGVAIFTVMRVWHDGVERVRQSLAEDDGGRDAFLANIGNGRVPRVPGTAVFLSRSGLAIPQVIVRHVAQMKVLQQLVVSLTVAFEEVPRVTRDCRAEVEAVGDGIWHVTAHFGFTEVPNIVAALVRAKELGCPIDLDDIVYFAARDAVVPRPTRPRMPGWRRILFAFMYRNAVRAPDRFALPVDNFLELGRQIGL
jgi:KUP system potassium uptake protein